MQLIIVMEVLSLPGEDFFQLLGNINQFSFDREII